MKDATPLGILLESCINQRIHIQTLELPLADQLSHVLKYFPHALLKFSSYSKIKLSL